MRACVCVFVCICGAFGERSMHMRIMPRSVTVARAVIDHKISQLCAPAGMHFSPVEERERDRDNAIWFVSSLCFTKAICGRWIH